ncbi:hypothetical protein CWE08_05075 [Aliidiomarina iranensis]|uniref:DUF3301 domain-containing protein n=1 Tax=Aliidiomarina iranensis TaxID=1434071 RepID=A0A432W0L2_9GAMM|nr:DUF3301 domain-containing protein [Aliidiomarina iranensis]RUO22550.1 hypothetical protein CWE08_05075 [Aliidiomarina iranensis]
MSANLYDVLALLLLLLGGYLFWQWRLQEEHARKHAEAVCKQYNVQFLDIARSRGRPRFTPRTGWEASFQFGFSSDIQTRYEGELLLLNLHLSDVRMPPHKAPAANHESAIEGETVSQSSNSAQGSGATTANATSKSSATTSAASTHSANAGWHRTEANTSKVPQPQVSPSTGPHQIPVPNSQMSVTSMSISYGERKAQSEGANANSGIQSANSGNANNTESDELPPIVDAIFPDDLETNLDSKQGANAADLEEGPAITIDGFNTTDG